MYGHTGFFSGDTAQIVDDDFFTQILTRRSQQLSVWPLGEIQNGLARIVCTDLMQFETD